MQIFMLVLISFTIAEMMFAMGIRMNFTRVAGSLTRYPGLAWRAVVVNYLVIPGFTLSVVLMFHVPPMIATGLMILAVCPAAPYGPPFTALARGDLQVSTGLMIILAGSSAFMAPLMLHLLLPVLSSDSHSFKINPRELIGTLFIIQLLPLFAGMAIGQWYPGLSLRLQKPAMHVSKVLNLLMILTVAWLQVRVITGTELSGLPVLLLIFAGSLATGWIAGWPGLQNRKSVSIITTLRNMSLAMGIAVASFPGTQVITTVLVYSFLAGMGLLIFTLILRFLP